MGGKWEFMDGRSAAVLVGAEYVVVIVRVEEASAITFHLRDIAVNTPYEQQDYIDRPTLGPRQSGKFLLTIEYLF